MSLISAVLNGDIATVLMLLLSRAFVVFCCLPIHELAHGYTAYKLGDMTAKNSGRLTFNPLAQLNPIGTIMIFLFGIGYANPVPVNPNNFKNPKWGMALTAIAGPISNLLMGFVSVFIYYAIAANATSTALGYVALFFYYAASVNVTLAVFNLIPIPPLDGSRVLTAFLPDSAYYKLMRYEKYIMIVLMVVLFTGVLNSAISAISSAMMTFISIIPRAIFY